MTTTQELKKTIVASPKTMKEIKSYYEEKFPEMKTSLNDNLIVLSVTKSPHSILEFFDTVDLVCTFHYESRNFIMYLNGEILIDDLKVISNENRKEALISAVIFLFKKREKTL
jgi:hypothetical protein